MSRSERALRWYPATWRERYGAELAALLEDTYREGPVPLGCRLSLVRSGIVEHLRAAAAGLGTSGPVRMRSGSLLVLCGWAAFVVAGAGYAKVAEHWDLATPARDRPVPALAYGAVQWAAFLGLLILVTGALLCVPALARLIRQGGWSRIRVPVLGALAVCALTALVDAGVVLAAQHFGNQAHHAWRWLFAGAAAGALLVGLSIALCTAAAVAVVRRLDLRRRVLRAEAVLALSMTGVMAVITVGTVLWWVSIAEGMPGFLGGGPVGWPGPPVPATLLLVGTVMVGGLAIAVLGAWSVTGALRADPGPTDPG